MNNIVRFIGDVHGKLREYAALTKGAKQSVCFGEMGFSKYELEELYDFDSDYYVDPANHVIIPGNHDNYDVIGMFEAFLTDPGYGLLGWDFKWDGFYVRGAASIDRHWRVEGVSWWPEEELSYADLNRAIDMYERVKPDIVVTHTCPDSLVEGLLPRGYVKHNFRTEKALQQMFEIHQPKLWIFGHMHVNKVFCKGNTTFIALGELATCDIDVVNCQIQDYSWM